MFNQDITDEVREINVVFDNPKTTIPIKYKQKKIIRKKTKIFYIILIILLSLISFFAFLFYFFIYKKSNSKLSFKINKITNSNTFLFNNMENMSYFSEYFQLFGEKEIDIKFSELKKIIGNHIALDNYQMYFLHSLVLRFKPKKLLEIGISEGGSSSILLYSIENIEGAKLYSIDKAKYCFIEKTKESGYIVNEKFPYLLKNWEKYTGNITAKFIEKIGNEIDFVFIDTAHIVPGEMLDILQILPFLKEEAVVILHDTNLIFRKWIKKKYEKTNFSNNQILVNLRGKLIMPTVSDSFLSQNIGGVKLERNQQKYYLQYFLQLNQNWEYMPEENDISLLKDFFRKYYGNIFVDIFSTIAENNKKFLQKSGIDSMIKYFNELYKTK